tara:strand:+ start:212 stop:409 length:198 start_codon:yes stop_codon:yes gene_type:complete
MEVREALVSGLKIDLETLKERSKIVGGVLGATLRLGPLGHGVARPKERCTLIVVSRRPREGPTLE